MRTSKTYTTKKVLTSVVLVVLTLFAFDNMRAQTAALTDENMADQIDKEFFMTADIPASKIDVSTNEGVVTLTGTVNNILAKERAERQAMAVKGVSAVVNRIEVDPPMRSDAALKKDAERALLQNPATESYEVDVMASNGKITLDGTVDSWQEKNLAAHVVKGVYGVEKVENDLTVDFITTRSDMDIKEDITQALSNDIRLFRNLIDVNVDNGMVQLDGTVGSLNEKNLVINYAWTNGVREVDAEDVKIRDWARDQDLRKKEIPMRSDAEIKEAIKDAFFYDPRVKSFNPEVKVNGGIVTLKGKVDNLQARDAAEADARNVVGVLSVRNNIKVSMDDMPVDEHLKSDIKASLEMDPYLNENEIDIAVQDGRVYLSGSVDTYFEKNEANREARKVPGVVRVVNNLDVTEESNYDVGNYYYYTFDPYYPEPFTYPEAYYGYSQTDWEIKENIENEIWWSPFVNKKDVTVTVDQGIATLTGTVDSWHEHEKAVENAFEGGATEVIDRMTIMRPGVDQ